MSFYSVLRVGGSLTESDAKLLMRSEEWEEGYQMGKRKADYLQSVTIVMFSVTWANLGEFSQGD